MCKLRNIIALLFVSILISGCEDNIDLELDNGKTQLVVDAFVTSDSSEQVITLSLSAPYFFNQETPRENNATVFVEGPNGKQFNFVNDGDGNFRYNPTLNGAMDSIGYTYKLSVIFDNKEYVSFSTLNPVPVIDSMTVAFEEEELGAEEGFYTQFYARDFAGRKDYYWIRPFKNGEAVYKDEPAFIILSEDAAFGGDGADGFVFILPLRAVITDSEFPFEVGDTSSVELLSLNRESYEFLDQVVNASGSDGLFATPPANYPTNILDASGNTQEEVLGIFSLSASSKSQIIIE